MKTPEGDGSRRISVEIPNQLINQFDLLKREWGLRARGDVILRLLEDILSDSDTKDLSFDSSNNELIEENYSEEKNNVDKRLSDNKYNEEKALVLIPKTQQKIIFNDTNIKKDLHPNNKQNSVSYSSSGIDLPGFVSKKTTNLRKSLKKTQFNDIKDDSLLRPIEVKDVMKGLDTVINHWLSLYGQKPKDNVVEAAMIWLARDIWPTLEGTEDCTFTWSGINKLMTAYCPTWQNKKATLERIIVLAGVLEDPFATANLEKRIPTLVRRFVNKFKRSQNVTSFQTLESTMTIHGALRLLGLPTLAGESLTLSVIRDSYKTKALTLHPDAGGSTEAMRKLNEAYKLLKELYRTNS